jgi:hypothetical protein
VNQLAKAMDFVSVHNFKIGKTIGSSDSLVRA